MCKSINMGGNNEILQPKGSLSSESVKAVGKQNNSPVIRPGIPLRIGKGLTVPLRWRAYSQVCSLFNQQTQIRNSVLSQ